MLSNFQSSAQATDSLDELLYVVVILLVYSKKKKSTEVSFHWRHQLAKEGLAAFIFSCHVDVGLF